MVINHLLNGMILEALPSSSFCGPGAALAAAGAGAGAAGAAAGTAAAAGAGAGGASASCTAETVPALLLEAVDGFQQVFTPWDLHEQLDFMVN